MTEKLHSITTTLPMCWSSELMRQDFQEVSIQEDAGGGALQGTVSQVVKEVRGLHQGYP